MRIEHRHLLAPAEHDHLAVADALEGASGTDGARQQGRREQSEAEYAHRAIPSNREFRDQRSSRAENFAITEAADGAGDDPARQEDRAIDSVTDLARIASV